MKAIRLTIRISQCIERFDRASIMVLPFAVVVMAMAFAHGTWLIAGRIKIPQGTTVTLDLTSGMAFLVDR